MDAEKKNLCNRGTAQADNRLIINADCLLNHPGIQWFFLVKIRQRHLLTHRIRREIQLLKMTFCFNLMIMDLTFQFISAKFVCMVLKEIMGKFDCSRQYEQDTQHPGSQDLKNPPCKSCLHASKIWNSEVKSYSNLRPKCCTHLSS